jgi:hypothetical protein
MNSAASELNLAADRSSFWARAILAHSRFMAAHSVPGHLTVFGQFEVVQSLFVEVESLVELFVFGGK